MREGEKSRIQKMEEDAQNKIMKNWRKERGKKGKGREREREKTYER